MAIIGLRKRADALSSQRSLVSSRLDDAESRLARARADQTDIDAVQRTVQYVAARVQSGFGNYVGALVTKALHHVFPDRRKDNFVVRFRENRGKTECELLLVTEKGEEAHPFDCAGGGVWDTLSFALRCAMLVLEQPAPSRLLFLDEPFKFLHGAAGRRRALRMMYNTFRTLGIQAVVVHQSDIASGDEIDESLDVIRNEPGVAVYEVRLTAYEKSEVKRV
ncbi:MAG: hypothetical protein BWY66_00575 [bacterium ADurb.Bin374]|nr:MAG: hypothetical protein BWY66_00575 [bacterium ADurb.Bin374]